MYILYIDLRVIWIWDTHIHTQNRCENKKVHIFLTIYMHIVNDMCTYIRDVIYTHEIDAKIKSVTNDTA